MPLRIDRRMANAIITSFRRITERGRVWNKKSEKKMTLMATQRIVCFLKEDPGYLDYFVQKLLIHEGI